MRERFTLANIICSLVLFLSIALIIFGRLDPIIGGLIAGLAVAELLD